MKILINILCSQFNSHNSLRIQKLFRRIRPLTNSMDSKPEFSFDVDVEITLPELEVI